MTQSPKRALVTPTSKKQDKAMARSSLRLRPPDVTSLPSDRKKADEAVQEVGANADLERHGAHVKRYLTWLRVPEFAVEELAQEALLVAHSRRGEFRNQSSLTTWLSGIAFHLVLNWRRRQRTRERWEDSSDAIRERAGRDGFAGKASVMEELLARDLWERVVQVLSEQSEVAHQLWIMVAVEEWAVTSAGRSLGSSDYQACQLFQRTQLRVKQVLARD